MDSDGSVYLAGYTRGDWSATNAGYMDFAAVKLHADGVEEWRWQVSYTVDATVDHVACQRF